MIITSNTIKNMPITIADVNIAEKVFGPDIGALKGKTTHSSIRLGRDSAYNVQMNYANPQEHVPQTERNNCVIKEQLRSAFH
jgi:hypothetical protein